MNFTFRHLASKIKNGITYGFVTGVCIGCIPNKVLIRFEDKKYYSLYTPLISGLICSTGIILSPLLIINYVSNGKYIDKLIDKYDINIKRYHQYDGENNKYAYPSLIYVNIKSKID